MIAWMTAWAAGLALAGTADAAACGPGRLGTARTIEVDTEGGVELGTLQYADTLALGPGELVFTFDDGPSPDHTRRILDTLDAHCVKATFFLVGLFAEAHPEIVREIARRGHTLANHSYSHQIMTGLGVHAGAADIERGEAAINDALAGLTGPDGRPARAAPFFRFPGLNHTRALRTRLAEEDVAVMSCDIGTDDWRPITSEQVHARALRNIEALGSGIIIMHDSKQRTADALPGLLDELAARGYTAVHMVASRE